MKSRNQALNRKSSSEVPDNFFRGIQIISSKIFSQKLIETNVVSSKISTGNWGINVMNTWKLVISLNEV